MRTVLVVRKKSESRNMTIDHALTEPSELVERALHDLETEIYALGKEAHTRSTPRSWTPSVICC